MEADLGENENLLSNIKDNLESGFKRVKIVDDIYLI